MGHWKIGVKILCSKSWEGQNSMKAKIWGQNFIFFSWNPWSKFYVPWKGGSKFYIFSQCLEKGGSKPRSLPTNFTEGVPPPPPPPIPPTPTPTPTPGQQSMTRLTNTAILLTYTSSFYWRFSGNWQEHICERNIRCFDSPSHLRHLSLGSDRLNVTVCRTCTVPLWDVQRTVGSWSYWKNILGWLALRSSSSPHLYSTIVFGITSWGEEGRMTVWL